MVSTAVHVCAGMMVYTIRLCVRVVAELSSQMEFVVYMSYQEDPLILLVILLPRQDKRAP